MIYLRVDPAEPIQQGDIFRNIPRIDFTLSELAIVGADEELSQTSWREVFTQGHSAGPVSALLSIRSVTAIVITQNCDASRGQFISLCQVDDYLEAFNHKDPPKSAKKWKNLIVEKARSNTRFYYLPESSNFGFEQKQAADFRVVLSIPRVDLEQMRDQRIAKLNAHANEHFRESLSHFFRRYAYNEWYPLNSEEFQAYSEDLGEPVKPYPGQEGESI